MATTNFQSYIWPIATALIAWGGFPRPPRMFSELARNEIFQYFLVFVLVWQGGGQKNIPMAATVTLIFFVATRLLDGNFGLCNNPQPVIIQQQI